MDSVTGQVKRSGDVAPDPKDLNPPALSLKSGYRLGENVVSACDDNFGHPLREFRDPLQQRFVRSVRPAVVTEGPDTHFSEGEADKGGQEWVAHSYSDDQNSIGRDLSELHRETPKTIEEPAHLPVWVKKVLYVEDDGHCLFSLAVVANVTLSLYRGTHVDNFLSPVEPLDIWVPRWPATGHFAPSRAIPGHDLEIFSRFEAVGTDRDPTENPFMTLERFLAITVRERRLALSWSQDDLAGKMRALGFRWSRSVVAGLERSAVSPNESEVRRVSLGELLGLAVIFGVSIPELFEEAPEVLGIDGENNSVQTAAVLKLLSGTPGEAVGADAFLSPLQRSDVAPPAFESLLGPEGVALLDQPGHWWKFLSGLSEIAAPGLDPGTVVEVDLPRLRENMGLPPQLTEAEVPEAAVLIRNLRADALGDFERYVGESLGIGAPAAALISRMLWGRSATEERDLREPSAGSRQKASKEITAAIEDVVRRGPRAAATSQASDHGDVSRKKAGLMSPARRVDRARLSDVSNLMVTNLSPLPPDRSAPPEDRFDLAVHTASLRPSKMYQGLYDFLADTDDSEKTLPFEEIAHLVNRPDLPKSAYHHRAWWANDPSHSHARSWLAAGWKVKKVDPANHEVTFQKQSD